MLEDLSEISKQNNINYVELDHACTKELFLEESPHRSKINYESDIKKDDS